MQQASNNKFLIFNFKFLSLAAVLGLLVASKASAQAICPVCVVAIGAGLGLSRWLKIDDLVSSVWIGAFMWTLVVWTIHWMQKKNWNFKFRGIITFLFYYLLTFIPLYYMGLVGHPLNKFLGVDKIILGTVIGTIILWASLKWHSYLKSKNNDKSYFPYQRVAIPVLALILTSLILWRIII